MKQLNFTFELTDEEFRLLLHIAEEGYAEYRDTEFETVEEFRKKVKPAHAMNELQYLGRNTNGTYHLIENLIRFNLIQHVDMAWHTTFELSEFGKLLLIFNNIDYKNQ